MKKINKILLVVFFSLVLTCMSSCSGIWEPVNNNIKYKEKRNYKEYSELKEPLAFSFEINQVFSSKDRNDVGMEFGNIVYFYDTENDEVYDYVYSPELYVFNWIENGFMPIVKNSKNEYNAVFIDKNANRLSVFNSGKKESQVYKIANNETWRIVNAGSEDIQNQYYVFYRHLKTNRKTNGTEEQSVNIYVYDANAAVNNEKAITDFNVVVRHIDEMSKVYADKNGNLYLSYSWTNNDQHRIYSLAKLNISEGKLENTEIQFDSNAGGTLYNGYEWSVQTYYTLKGIKDNKAVFVKENHTNVEVSYNETEYSVVLVDLDTKETKEYFISDNKSAEIKKVCYLNNKLYAACFHKESYDNPNDLTVVMNIVDCETGTIKAIKKEGKSFNSINDMVLRNNKLYLLNKKFISRINERHLYLCYFDIASEEFSSEKDLTPADISK